METPSYTIQWYSEVNSKVVIVASTVLTKVLPRPKPGRSLVLTQVKFDYRYTCTQRKQHVGYTRTTQKCKWVQNHPHMWALWLWAKNQEQVQREAGPLGHEAFQGENRQNLPPLQTLLLPKHRVRFRGEGQTSPAEALHWQTRCARALSQRSSASQRYQLPLEWQCKEEINGKSKS